MTWHVPVPYFDEWDQFPQMIALRDADFSTSNVFTYAWAQHNEHRIVIPKFIYFLDMTYFDYKGYFPLVCIFIFQTMVVGMLAWLLVSNKNYLLAKLLFISFAIVAVFDLTQYENFLSTFQTSFVGCFAFAVTALVLYAKYVESERRAYLFSAVIFASLSSLSLASGLFIWLALALLAYFIRAKHYVQSFAFVGTFLMFLLLYLHGYISPAIHANPVDSLIHHPLLVLNFLAIWLGNIAGTVSAAKLLGSIGLFALIVLVVYLVRGEKRTHHVQIYTLLGICLFVLMAGFVISLGRINFGVEQAMASRYSTPVLLFWMGLLGSFLLVALESGRALLIRAAVMFVLAAYVGLLAHHSRGENAMIAFQNQLSQGYLGITTGAYNNRPQLLLSVYPIPGLIIDKINLLRSHHLSSFSASRAKPFEMGSLFSSLGNHHRQCMGHVNSVSAVAKDTYQITGWAWNEASSSFPEWIYLVKGGKVIGLGKPGIQRPDVITAIPSINKIRVGWQGFARDANDLKLDNIEAYLVTRDGVYCQFVP
jgi:MFS family permease